MSRRQTTICTSIPAPLRGLGWLSKKLDLAHHSYSSLERRQYLGPQKPIIIVNSEMVRRHFQHYYSIGPAEIRVIYSTIDPNRFLEQDRPRHRAEWRQHWGLETHETVALLAAMNYRLKGLEPLLHAIRRLPKDQPFRLLIAGDARTDRYARLRPDSRHRRSRSIHWALSGYAKCLLRRGLPGPSDLLRSLLSGGAGGTGLRITHHYHTLERPERTPQPAREGYVIDTAHDHEHLAWCMSQLFNPARRSSCAQAARRTATQWTFEHHYQQLLHVFTEAVARKQAA